MATESTSAGAFSTRRSILTSAAAAAAGAVAASLAAGAPVLAADGDPVLAGTSNSASLGTVLNATGADGSIVALDVQGGQGIAVEGTVATGTGVKGVSSSGPGVWGTTIGADAPGVRGTSTSGAGVDGMGGYFGVRGTLNGPTGYGVYGDGIDTGTGVLGTSAGVGHAGVHAVNTSLASGGVALRASSSFGPAIWADAPNDIAVSAVSTSSTGVVASGVDGVIASGDQYGADLTGGVAGVIGRTTGGVGAQGEASSAGGVGVFGDAADAAGVGVRARSATGTALKVEGKASFSRSGTATVLAGRTSVVVSVSGNVAATSLCFANLTALRAGVAVAAVRPNYPTGKLTIYLTKAVTSNTKVAWFVLG